MIKLCLSLLVCVLSVLLHTSDVSALSVNGSYGNVTSTSNTVIDLVNYAISYDTFLENDFIVFQAEQYVYYIVWGDLEYSSNKVTGSSIEYIKYSRDPHTSGYNYSYIYDYGTDTSFSYTLNDFTIVSNFNDFGFSSETYRIHKFNDIVIKFLILLTGFIFVTMVKTLRRSNE